MANVRSLNKKKYGISKNRFHELYYHCLQYDEWKTKIRELQCTLRGMQYGKIAMSGNAITSSTEEAAIECAELSAKCDVIELTAKEADNELYEYLLEAVTHKGVTYKYLSARKRIPCGPDRFYDRRRKFYWLLDKKLKESRL